MEHKQTHGHTHIYIHTYTSTRILWSQRREELILNSPWQLQEKFHRRQDNLIVLRKMYSSLLGKEHREAFLIKIKASAEHGGTLSGSSLTHPESLESDGNPDPL